MDQILELFFTFIKIGTFTFGGGYAMISMIENNCVENKKWISHEDMMNIAVIAESTPGPIAINCATFVGYKKKGIPGAVAATVGVVLPSFFIICLIAFVLDHFLEITVIANAFCGIKLAVGILILDAAVKMIQKLQKRLFPCVILICAAILMVVIDVCALKISTITMMLSAGCISLFLCFAKELAGRIGEGK